MAFKDWDSLSFFAQADLIISMFPTLTEEQIRGIYDKWSENVYEDNIIGELIALQDLQNLARRASMTDEQKDEERKRLQEQI